MRYTTAELRRMQSRTDLARVEDDEAAGKPVILDGDDTPLTAGELDNAKRRREPQGMQKTSTQETFDLRVDRSVVAAFRSMGEGWQKKMNAVLREHVKGRKAGAADTPRKKKAGTKARKRAAKRR